MPPNMRAHTRLAPFPSRGFSQTPPGTTAAADASPAGPNRSALATRCKSRRGTMVLAGREVGHPCSRMAFGPALFPRNAIFLDGNDLLWGLCPVWAVTGTARKIPPGTGRRATAGPDALAGYQVGTRPHSTERPPVALGLRRASPSSDLPLVPAGALPRMGERTQTISSRVLPFS